LTDTAFNFLTAATDEIVASLSVEGWDWQEFPYTNDEWNQMFKRASSNDLAITEWQPKLRLERYPLKLYFPLSEEYELFWMDFRLWLAQIKTDGQSRHFTKIYSLLPLELQRERVITPPYQGDLDKDLYLFVIDYLTNFYYQKDLGISADLGSYSESESLTAYLRHLVRHQEQYISSHAYQRYNYQLVLEVLEAEKLPEDKTYLKLAASAHYNVMGLDEAGPDYDIVHLIVNNSSKRFQIVDQYVQDGLFDVLLRGPDFDLKVDYQSNGMASLTEETLRQKAARVEELLKTSTSFPGYEAEELKDKAERAVIQALEDFARKLYENKNLPAGRTHDLAPYIEGEILTTYLSEKIRVGQYISERMNRNAGGKTPGQSDTNSDQFEVETKLLHLEQVEDDIYLSQVQVSEKIRNLPDDWVERSSVIDLLVSITEGKAIVLDCYSRRDTFAQFDQYVRGENLDLKFEYLRNKSMPYLDNMVDIVAKASQLIDSVAQ